MDDTLGVTIMSAKAAWVVAVLLIFGGAVVWFSWQNGPAGGSGQGANPFHWLTSMFWEPGPPAVGELGHLVKGRFEEPDQLSIWIAEDENDLVGIDPQILLHGQMVRLADEFPLGPPVTLRARVQSFRSDGSPVSPGVSVQFKLITNVEGSLTYRSEKPLILMQNATLEREWPGVIAIFADGECWTKIVAD